MVSASKRGLITWHGLPAAMEYAGMLPATTLPAPMTAPWPMSVPDIRMAFAPIDVAAD